MATTKHTCGGPVFGKRTAGCPRCDELSAGAAPVKWNIRKADTFRASDYCHHNETPLGAKCDTCGKYQYCD